MKYPVIAALSYPCGKCVYIQAYRLMIKSFNCYRTFCYHKFCFFTPIQTPQHYPKRRNIVFFLRKSSIVNFTQKLSEAIWKWWSQKSLQAKRNGMKNKCTKTDLILHTVYKFPYFTWSTQIHPMFMHHYVTIHLPHIFLTENIYRISCLSRDTLKFFICTFH